MTKRERMAEEASTENKKESAKSSIFDDVKEMHKKFGFDKVLKDIDLSDLIEYLNFRLDFINEELQETRDALDAHDINELVDGLTDILVVTAGTLDVIDVNGQKAWDIVHKTNMAKEVGENESRPNNEGFPDLVKPSTWQAPDLSKTYKKDIFAQ